MRKRFCFLIVALIGLPISIVAQEQKNDLLDFQTSPEYIDQIAANRSKTLVFKLLQFEAPFRGGYHETFLDKTGKTSDARVLPFARQMSRFAVLSKSQIKAIREKLVALIAKTTVRNPQSTKGERYAVLVIYDGQKKIRIDFAGQIPAELQEIKDLLNLEYQKAEKIWYENFLKLERENKEKYGNWLETPGILRPATSGSQSVKNERAVFMYRRAMRQPVTEKSPQIPLYYALVFYSEGFVRGGAGGGTWGFEPVSRTGITWATGNNYKKPGKQLVIEYNAISGELLIGEKRFALSAGNLFIIRMNKKWQPQVEQLNERIDEDTALKKGLDVFGKTLGREFEITTYLP
jgi:hypothetical protein